MKCLATLRHKASLLCRIDKVLRAHYYQSISKRRYITTALTESIASGKIDGLELTLCKAQNRELFVPSSDTDGIKEKLSQLLGSEEIFESLSDERRNLFLLNTLRTFPFIGLSGMNPNTCSIFLQAFNRISIKSLDQKEIYNLLLAMKMGNVSIDILDSSASRYLVSSLINSLEADNSLQLRNLHQILDSIKLIQEVDAKWDLFDILAQEKISKFFMSCLESDLNDIDIVDKLGVVELLCEFDMPLDEKIMNSVFEMIKVLPLDITRESLLSITNVLSKCSDKINDLSSFEREALINRIELLLETNNAPIALQLLESFETRIGEISQTAFQNCLKFLSSSEDALNIAFVLHGLSSMKLEWKDLDVEQQELVLDSFQRTCRAVVQDSTASRESIVAITSSLYSISSIGCDFSDWTPDLCTAYWTAVNYSLHLWEPPALSNQLLALGRMNYPWSSIPNDTQDLIFKTWMKLFRPMSHQEFCNSLLGFSRMKSCWSILPHHLASQLLACCTRILASMTTANLATNIDDQHRILSMMIYSLGNLRCQWTALSRKFRSNYIEELSRSLPDLGATALSNNIYSLGQLNAEWTHFDPSLRNLILASITRNCNSYSPQEYGMVLHGLSSMNWEWRTVNLSDGEVLVAEAGSILEKLKQLPHYGWSECTSLTMIIYALGKVKCSWIQLDPNFRNLFTELFVAFQDNWIVDPKGIADVLYGLGQMGAKWWRFDSEFHDVALGALDACLPTMQHNEIANSILGLRHMGVEWDLLPYSTVQAIASNVTKWLQSSCTFHDLESCHCHSLTAIIYSFGIMGCTWSEMSSPFQSHYQKLVQALNSRWTPAGISNNLEALGMMRAKWASLSPKFQDFFFEALRRNCSSMTNQEICNSLRGLSSCRCSFDSIPDTVKLAIMKRLTRLMSGVSCNVCDGITSVDELYRDIKSVSIVIETLSEWDFDWNKFQHPFQAECLKCIQIILPHCTSTFRLLMIVDGLEQMKVDSSLITQIREAIQVLDKKPSSK